MQSLIKVFSLIFWYYLGYRQTRLSNDNIYEIEAVFYVCFLYRYIQNYLTTR